MLCSFLLYTEVNQLYVYICPGFLGGSEVKNPPAMQAMQVQSLTAEGPLEKGMATHCSILAWEIPGTEEPGGLPPMRSQESDIT